MSLATLLNVPGDAAGRSAFSFEHAMAHRDVMHIMGPLDQWSVMPYFIDPADFNARPGEKWNLNHQQAHNDFLRYLPAHRQSATAGVPSDHIVLDSRLNNPDSRQWWTFVNHQEHFIVISNLAPLPLQQPQADWPWWLLDPRLVLTFW